MTALEWSWGDSPLTFLPQRALWRAEGRELFVADLHLGKAEVFQAHGIPMPCLLYTSPSPRDRG